MNIWRKKALAGPAGVSKMASLVDFTL